MTRDWMGNALVPGVNVDRVDIGAGVRQAEVFGYSDGKARMVATYALQRHARGEEDGAQRTWLSEYPNDLTSWMAILAAACAPTPEEADSDEVRRLAARIIAREKPLLDRLAPNDGPEGAHRV